MQKKKLQKKKHEYIIFPLCCLSLKLDYKSLIINILQYSYVKKSLQVYLDAISVSKTKYTNEKPIKKLKCKSLNINKKRANFMKQYRNYLQSFNHVREHIISFQKKYGKDAMVSIHINLLKEQLEKHTLSEDMFRILCAIYSKLGRSEYNLIYNDEIRVRALGYKSINIYLIDKGLEQLDMENLFSDKVLRTIITFLSGDGKKNLYRRAYNGRKYYYSTKLNIEELKQIVDEKKGENSRDQKKAIVRFKEMKAMHQGKQTFLPKRKKKKREPSP